MPELKNIEAERARYGLSTAEVCTQLGVSRKTYFNYIKGETPVPSKHLLTLSRLFHCSVDYILGIKTEKN